MNILDILAVIVYFVIVLYIGKRASRAASANEEGFFLAGRKLGKLYQFFLNFGQATDANGAVSTTSLVYQQGVSGVWMAFQTIFMNPYYWFMNQWFRRVRLVTMADLFEDRLNSRSLARFYAVFQVLAAVVVMIGYGNLVAYKITASLIVKPEAQWSVEERQSVEDYRELKSLESELSAGTMAPAQQPRLEFLRDRDARGELSSNVPLIGELLFYAIYTLVVGIYIIMGGMSAAALNEAFQGVLIVIFSCLLIPFGLAAIGGAGMLAEKVPEEAFDLFGNTASQVNGLALIAILFVSIVQIHGIIGNMGIAGSAKNEFSARFGAVAGTYAKRIMIILWAFCGLIAIALYKNAGGLSDPDSAWGVMSRHLLGPGFLGLMLAGVLAANMSSVSTQAMSISALFVRNIYSYIKPASSQSHLLLVGRVAIAVILIVGIIAALNMNDFFVILQLMLTVNVPFGAAIVLMFIWRRLTSYAVWTAVLLSAIVNIIAPWIAPKISAIRENPAILVCASDDMGRQLPVFFDSVVRSDPSDSSSSLVGRGRFHVELWVLDHVGMDVVSMEPGTRLAARFFFDGLLPFILLIGVSLFSRAPARQVIDRFYGKMKTPVGATPEQEADAMAETMRNPSRFDQQKLFPRSSLELTRWNRTDTVGFLICCAVSGLIVTIFWFILGFFTKGAAGM